MCCAFPSLFVLLGSAFIRSFQYIISISVPCANFTSASVRAIGLTLVPFLSSGTIIAAFHAFISWCPCFPFVHAAIHAVRALSPPGAAAIALNVIVVVIVIVIVGAAAVGAAAVGAAAAAVAVAGAGAGAVVVCCCCCVVVCCGVVCCGVLCCVCCGVLWCVVVCFGRDQMTGDSKRLKTLRSCN